MGAVGREILEVVTRKGFPEEGCIQESQKRIENLAGILGGSRVSSLDSLNTTFPKYKG